MWAAVGTALKKIAASIFTSKKGLKIAGGIILGLIIVVISPVLVIMALFGGYEKSPPDFFVNNVMENLDDDRFENIASVGNKMTEIEDRMLEEEYSEDDIEAANLLYTTTLYRYSSEEDFVDRFIACFEDNEDDEELIDKVNEEFGTDIDIQEFRDILGI